VRDLCGVIRIFTFVRALRPEWGAVRQGCSCRWVRLVKRLGIDMNLRYGIRPTSVLLCLALLATILLPAPAAEAQFGPPPAPVLRVEDGWLRWTQPSSNVEVGGHNVHKGSGAYVTTVTGSDRWDLAGRTGVFFVTAFDRTPDGAQIGPRSNAVNVGGSNPGDTGGDTGGGDTGGDPGGGSNLPAGFGCGNWPPVPSSTTEGAEPTDDAKAAVFAQCGQRYDNQQGDQCRWVDARGWQCMIKGGAGNPGGGTPGGGLEPPDPNAGGPNGDGPRVPRNVTAVAVSGHPDGVNPNGILVSWTPGPGEPRSIGYNVHRATGGGEREFLLSILDQAWFVDCNVEANTSYHYTISAWAEGSKPSFTTLPVEGRTSTKPSKCRPLTPPGPSGDNEPSTDPLFDVARNYGAKPATPQNVRIVGTGSSARLQWEMPPSARMVFQITRNALREAESEDLWGQIQVTPGHQDMTFSNRGDGGVRMSFPVGRFSPGDNFVIQAAHPWSISKEEIPSNVRFSKQSRFATITRAGKGRTQANFFDSFDRGEQPKDDWIGKKSDWNSVPQFSDNFDGTGELANSSNARFQARNGEPDAANRWYFARNDGTNEITAANSREKNQTDDRAILDDGKLEMSARLSDGTYSYGRPNQRRIR